LRVSWAGNKAPGWEFKLLKHGLSGWIYESDSTCFRLFKGGWSETYPKLFSRKPLWRQDLQEFLKQIYSKN
jgi:hypothetical protein